MWLTSLALASALALPQDGAVVGRPCPAMPTDATPLQGAMPEFEEAADHVVVVALFQLGCEPSWSKLLPLVQELSTRWAKDDRLLLLGAATDWPPGQFADAGLDTKVRAELASHRFYFPVVRDRDGKLAQMLAVDGRTGTPRLLVVGHGGEVRWLGAVDSEEKVAQARGAVEEAMATYWVAAIPDLPAELAAYLKGDLPAAALAARRILSDDQAKPELAAAAKQVEANLEAGARRLLEEAKAWRAKGFPARARARLTPAAEQFALVPAAVEAVALLADWKADKGFQRELAGEVLLGKTLHLLTTPKDQRRQVRDRLEHYAELYKDTPLAPRIAAAIASLH